MTLGQLMTNIQYDDKNRSEGRSAHRMSRANQALQQLTRIAEFSWLKTDGQINLIADYSTGYVSSIVSGAKAVTFTGATLTADMEGSHLRMGADLREYILDSVDTGAGTAVLRDPYEGTTIASNTTFLIRKRRYPAPFNFQGWLAGNYSGTLRVVRFADRMAHEERLLNNIGVTSDCERIYEAGTSTKARYAVGTVAINKGETTVTVTTGVTNANRDIGRRFRLRGSSIDFEITACPSSSTWTLAQAWPFENVNAQAYEIDPPGQLLLEPWPIPGTAKSLMIWYYRKERTLINSYESPSVLPEAWHDVWEMQTRALLGVPVGDDYAARMREFMKSDGVARIQPILMEAAGSPGYRVHNLPSNYEETDIWEGQWHS